MEINDIRMNVEDNSGWSLLELVGMCNYEKDKCFLLSDLIAGRTTPPWCSSPANWENIPSPPKTSTSTRTPSFSLRYWEKGKEDEEGERERLERSAEMREREDQRDFIVICQAVKKVYVLLF